MQVLKGQQAEVRLDFLVSDGKPSGKEKPFFYYIKEKKRKQRQG